MNKEIKINDKKIFYRIKGSGKPVILIHGFGEDSSIWKKQVEFLKDKYQLIIPDLPGTGQSDLVDDMSMEGTAGIINSIILEEKIEALPVIGHSMGGYITLALVEKYKNKVSAFGLFHSSAFADSEEKKAARQKGIEFIQQHGAFEFLKTSTPNLFSPLTKENNPASVQAQIDSLSNFSAAALVSYLEAMMQRPDRTEILRKTAVPVLFIMGKYDNAVPLEDGLKQCHLPEKSYIHILQLSGHLGMLEETENSNRILEEFLQEI